MSALPLHATGIELDMPPGRHATVPPEWRGERRDDVRLMVVGSEGIRHQRFRQLPSHLRSGDLLVVNTSHTRPSALDGIHRGVGVVVHLSTRQAPRRWTVELRLPSGEGPVLDGRAGERVRLVGHRGSGDVGSLELIGPAAAGPGGVGVRLWHATVTTSGGLPALLRDHARPITYGRDAVRLPLSAHQTVVATPEGPGSAEMPSAARPLTGAVLAGLRRRGVVVAPVTLHAGVSSQDAGEAPQPEWFDVPAATARLVNTTRARGGRIVAVGTTVTRALESATHRGRVLARHGWTGLVITPSTGVRVVDGLLTGWHDPQASHLLLLRAVAGEAMVQAAYAAAVQGPYLWHELGDSCLLLPQPVSARSTS